MRVPQTPEDQAINRRLADRLGTWSFLDGVSPSHARADYALALKLAWLSRIERKLSGSINAMDYVQEKATE